MALEPTDRANHVIERLKNMVILAIGQKRLVGRKKERASGFMHAFIFWGFCILLIRSLTLYGEGFVPGFQLPFLGDEYILGYLYIAVKRYHGRYRITDGRLRYLSSGNSKTGTVAQHMGSVFCFGHDWDFDDIRSFVRWCAL